MAPRLNPDALLLNYGITINRHHYSVLQSVCIGE